MVVEIRMSLKAGEVAVRVIGQPAHFRTISLSLHAPAHSSGAVVGDQLSGQVVQMVKFRGAIHYAILYQRCPVSADFDAKEASYCICDPPDIHHPVVKCIWV